MAKPEYNLRKHLADSLKSSHPRLLYRFDLVDLAKLPPPTAKTNKLVQCSRGYPDFSLLQPVKPYHGAFLELKTSLESVLRQDGQIRADQVLHLVEQAVNMLHLARSGYFVAFTFGLDNTLDTIEDYLASTAEKPALMPVASADLMIKSLIALRDSPKLLLELDPWVGRFYDEYNELYGQMGNQALLADK